MRVMRTPVAAKTALAIAGCTTTVPYRKMGKHALNLYRNLKEMLGS